MLVDWEIYGNKKNQKFSLKNISVNKSFILLIISKEVIEVPAVLSLCPLWEYIQYWIAIWYYSNGLYKISFTCVRKQLNSFALLIMKKTIFKFFFLQCKPTFKRKEARQIRYWNLELSSLVFPFSLTLGRGLRRRIIQKFKARQTESEITSWTAVKHECLLGHYQTFLSLQRAVVCKPTITSGRTRTS